MCNVTSVVLMGDVKRVLDVLLAQGWVRGEGCSQLLRAFCLHLWRTGSDAGASSAAKKRLAPLQGLLVLEETPANA